jgi:MFS family permease
MTDLLNDRIFIGSLSCFIEYLGSAFVFPFLQSQRDSFGCDALCYGTMQSSRSFLNLVGSFLISRLSDNVGRRSILWLGKISALLTLIINLYGTSLNSLWFALIPSALLNHGYSVMKAFFADVCHEHGYSESQRASAIGRLGMVAGLSFMIGPVVAASLFSSYAQAVQVAILFTGLSSIGLFLLQDLPPSSLSSKEPPIAVCYSEKELEEVTASEKATWDTDYLYKFKNFLYFPSLSKPGSKLLFYIRFSMAFAYHIFMTVYTVSLSGRFAFGPKDHAYLMGWIGFWYAISQGFLAKWMIALFQEKRFVLLLEICVLCLGIGRVVAFYAPSLVLVYTAMTFVIISLGIMNTAIATACTRLAGKEEVGGLYGALESVESIGGIIGPVLGGILQKQSNSLPVIAVVMIYASVFVGIYFFYEKHILSVSVSESAKSHKD